MLSILCLQIICDFRRRFLGGIFAEELKNPLAPLPTGLI
jgi:hypothetical protein